MSHYFNPYAQSDFFSFFFTLLQRLYQYITGDLGTDKLAADEIQILVLGGIAISSAFLGTFLILRRMTMLANSLSHTILLGIVLTYLLTYYIAEDHSHINISAMLIASVATGIVTTFLTEFLTTKVRLQSDASNGLVFTSMFALGIILITAFTRNAHIGTEAVMGNVDALQLSDLKLVFIVLALNLLLFSILFKEFKVTTFDSNLANSLGVSTTFFNYLLMVQVSATAIGAFRAVGVLMFLAFIVGPPLTARFFTHNLKVLLTLSAAIGSLASIFGVALARHLLSVHGIPLSTAGLVVCVIVGFYCIAALIGWKKNQPKKVLCSPASN